MFAAPPLPDVAAAGASLFAMAFWLLNIVVHVAFALAVWTHASPRKTALVAPPLWALATLAGGPLVALAYWLMHASSLATPAKDN